MTFDDLFKLASAASLVLGVYLTWQTNRGKTRKDTVEELYKMIDLLKADMKSLREDMAKLEREKDDLENWARRLVYQLQSNGIEPVPFRPEMPRTNE